MQLHFHVTVTRQPGLEVREELARVLRCHVAGVTPSAADVLDCLASDSNTIDNARNFEDFCSDLGYDSDSRKAEKIYKACRHAAKRLRNFIGDQYETLVYNTERL